MMDSKLSTEDYDVNDRKLFGWKVEAVTYDNFSFTELRFAVRIKCFGVSSSELFSLYENDGLRIGCQILGDTETSPMRADIRGRMDAVEEGTISASFRVMRQEIENTPACLAKISFLYEFSFWFYERGGQCEWIAIAPPATDRFSTYFDTFNTQQL